VALKILVYYVMRIACTRFAIYSLLGFEVSMVLLLYKICVPFLALPREHRTYTFKKNKVNTVNAYTPLVRDVYVHRQVI
jgi:hypothetical protein